MDEAVATRASTVQDEPSVRFQGGWAVLRAGILIVFWTVPPALAFGVSHDTTLNTARKAVVISIAMAVAVVFAAVVWRAMTTTLTITTSGLVVRQILHRGLVPWTEIDHVEVVRRTVGRNNAEAIAISLTLVSGRTVRIFATLTGALHRNATIGRLMTVMSLAKGTAGTRISAFDPWTGAPLPE